ncbi:MAG: sigma-70 family RNA polymerase sigma factor [Solirubrobacterales bacterium]|nr:sigma-70 family RNA polymerase sigma factor [Solirubrobacterales bacterium]
MLHQHTAEPPGRGNRLAARRDPTPLPRRSPVVIDARLRAQFRDGDPDAVRAAYSAYGRLVFAVAHRILADRGLAEEATQQTFLKAWRSAGSLDPGRELGPWLATIAKRVSIDVYRRETRRAARSLDDVPADGRGLGSTAFTVEQAHDIWEVRRAVSLLPGEEREVVRAQHFEGLTHEQIADRLGIPVGTVKSRSFRAHRRLASELGHLRHREPSCRCG